MSKKNFKILGQAGQENFRVENCPMHLPKENIKFFKYLKDESDHDPYDNYQQYGNAYKEDWHKPAKIDKSTIKIMESKIMDAINEGIKAALKEIK